MRFLKLKNWIKQREKAIAENNILDKHADELIELYFEFKLLRSKQNKIIQQEIDEAANEIKEWEAKL